MFPFANLQGLESSAHQWEKHISDWEALLCNILHISPYSHPNEATPFFYNCVFASLSPLRVEIRNAKHLSVYERGVGGWIVELGVRETKNIFLSECPHTNWW